MNGFIRDLMAEAHQRATRPDGSVSSQAVPVHFVDLLREHEGSNPGFIGGYIEKLAHRGAARAAADYRRTLARVPGKTKGGKAVAVPALAGIRRRTEAGTTEYVQVPHEQLTLDEKKAKRSDLEATRNTLSVQIAALTNEIDADEAAARRAS